MSPEVYQQARANAPMHVQLLRGGVRGQRDQRGGSVRVHGWVVRIFRDRDRALHFLQPISFSISIIPSRREEPPMPSGQIRHDWGYLGRARFLEAFLEESEGGLHLVLSQVLALRYPTVRPVCLPGAEAFLCEGTL